MRFRSLLAATAVAAVLAHGLSGHGMPQLVDDDMAKVAAGFCLLLVTVLTVTAAPNPEAGERPGIVALPSIHVPRAAHAMPDARSRASPRALQRFRN